MLLQRCYFAMSGPVPLPTVKMESPRFRGLCPTGATGLEPATPGFGDLACSAQRRRFSLVRASPCASPGQPQGIYWSSFRRDSQSVSGISRMPKPPMLKAARLITCFLERLETLPIPLQRGLLIAEISNCRQYVCTIKPSLFAASCREAADAARRAETAAGATTHLEPVTAKSCARKPRCFGSASRPRRR